MIGSILDDDAFLFRFFSFLRFKIWIKFFFRPLRREFLHILFKSIRTRNISNEKSLHIQIELCVWRHLLLVKKNALYLCEHFGPETIFQMKNSLMTFSITKFITFSEMITNIEQKQGQFDELAYSTIIDLCTHIYQLRIHEIAWVPFFGLVLFCFILLFVFFYQF